MPAMIIIVLAKQALQFNRQADPRQAQAKPQTTWLSHIKTPQEKDMVRVKHMW